MAVPTIFDPEHETSDNIVLQENNVCIEKCVFENIDVPVDFDLDDATNSQDDNMTIQNAVAPECDCATMKEKIQVQSQQIFSQSKKIQKQSDEILLLKQKNQNQSNEVNDLRAQLNELTSKFQCGLVRFAMEANDVKVNQKCYKHTYARGL